MPYNCLEYIQNLLLPHLCLICHAKSQQKLMICAACQQALPWKQNTCQSCGNTLFENHQFCGKCLHDPPPYQQLITLFNYQQPITRLITELKFKKDLAAGQLLGKLFAEYFSTLECKIQPDYLIPVPLHYRRLRQRGYNQALELARPISQALKIPIMKNLVTRIAATNAQTRTPAKLRQKNVANAFAIVQGNVPLKIALIDDVVTTGNTVAELSRSLHKAGAQHIQVWCMAKTR